MHGFNLERLEDAERMWIAACVDATRQAAREGGRVEVMLIELDERGLPPGFPGPVARWLRRAVCLGTAGSAIPEQVLADASLAMQRGEDVDLRVGPVPRKVLH